VRPVLAVFLTELRILARNKWVTVALALMTGFSLLIALAGSSPVGELGADHMTVTVASLATLTVYLVPLVALLISYDAVAGEASRGTLALIFTYPLSRGGLMAGKLLAQFAVLAFAIVAGLVSATGATALAGDPVSQSLSHVVRLAWSGCLLGAAFLAIGNLVSTTTRETGTAAALVIAIWIVAVVMYDIALLAALVGDDGGFFSQTVFPWLLIASPTDAFRLYNLSQIDPALLAGGISGATRSSSISMILPLASLIVWPLSVTACAVWLLNRYRP
jgi:Cu-processing system permease protein